MHASKRTINVPELLLLLLRLKVPARTTLQVTHHKLVETFNCLLSATNLVLPSQANTSLKHQVLAFTNFRITTLSRPCTNTVVIPLHLTVYQANKVNKCTANVITPSLILCHEHIANSSIDSQAAAQPKYEQ
jgi:hypothetical protein